MRCLRGDVKIILTGTGSTLYATDSPPLGLPLGKGEMKHANATAVMPYLIRHPCIRVCLPLAKGKVAREAGRKGWC